MIKNKKMFITGGAGFIGSSLVGSLIEDNQIIVYDKLERNALISKSYAKHPNLRIIEGDILNRETLADALEEDVEYVIHAAAIAGIDNTIINPVNTMRVNVLGTANILEAIYRKPKILRFLDFSTSEVFGSMAYKVGEETSTVTGAVGEARWTYAVSKLAGEHLSYSYYKQYDLPTVTVRPFNIYGPGQIGEGAIHVFIRKALNNEDLYIFGEGNQIRAWCYIDDMLRGLLACLTDSKAVGESFNIGNARAVTTIYGLAQTVCRVLNSKSRIIFKKPLSADIELRIPNVDKIKELLGFESRVDLEEGVIKTAEWYLGHNHELPELPQLFTTGEAVK